MNYANQLTYVKICYMYLPMFSLCFNVIMIENMYGIHIDT